MDRLDAGAIALPGFEVRVLERCSSTNAVLLDERRSDVLLAAEEQTAGRGRRGRRWYSAPGDGVTFSLSRTLRQPLRAQWQAMDAHAGARLRVRLADGRVLTGVARGLDGDGGLRLETRSGLRAVRSGRVLSARPA